jgi:hypothetical protein
MDHMKRILIKAVIASAAFLEFADDEILNPDTAVNELENLASTLQELTPEERREFLSHLDDLAQQYMTSDKDSSYAGFLSGLGEMLGLKEEEPVDIEELRKYQNFIDTSD